MNEKKNKAKADGAAGPPACDCAADLVAYLYGEATPGEAELFRMHLNACAACRDELAAFGDVRHDLNTWRAETFGFTSASMLDETEVHAPVVNFAPQRKRSATAALREFFTLSPRWLPACTAAVVLLLCALSVPTVMRSDVSWDAGGFTVRTGGGERNVAEPVALPAPANYTQAQFDAVVAERVGVELEIARRQWELTQRKEAETSTTSIMPISGERAEPPRRQVVSDASPRQTRRRQTTTRASQRNGPQLADEEALPRLSDLLSEVN